MGVVGRNDASSWGWNLKLAPLLQDPSRGTTHEAHIYFSIFNQERTPDTHPLKVLNIQNAAWSQTAKLQREAAIHIILSFPCPAPQFELSTWILWASTCTSGAALTCTVPGATKLRDQNPRALPRHLIWGYNNLKLEVSEKTNKQTKRWSPKPAYSHHKWTTSFI